MAEGDDVEEPRQEEVAERPPEPAADAQQPPQAMEEVQIEQQPDEFVDEQLAAEAMDDGQVPPEPGQEVEAANDDNSSERSSASFRGFDDNILSFENSEMAEVLQKWELKHTESGYDPVPALKRLAEIFERETEIYMRKDPDPFDERHPYRTDPSCQFGFLLKSLFRKDVFMNKLVNDYLRDNYFMRQNVQKSSLELNILACRLILLIMPGLETSAVFQAERDTHISRIYTWAEDSIEPLQSYATGLLAAAMEVTDIAVNFRDSNVRLVPKLLKRLTMLQAIQKWSNLDPTEDSQDNNDVDMNSIPQSPVPNDDVASTSGQAAASMANAVNHSMDESTNQSTVDLSHLVMTDSLKADLNDSAKSLSMWLGNANDSGTKENSERVHAFKKMYIKIHPPTVEASQMLILRFLTSMGEYQEFLGLVFENNAMQLIFGYIENLDRRDTCLAFEALKYLASLLCHKKFALEFLANGGLTRLLKVPRPSIAATGVSITLYYLAYSEDAMERICTMPKPILTDLVRYALWILGRSYDSGKCHATMFFGLSFQFKVILDEFDAQDGLRKLYNVISVLKILNPSNDEVATQQSEDVECASRQLVRHVCVALKRYMESHLFYKYNQIMHAQYPNSSEYATNITKATKSTLEQCGEQIRTLQENTSARFYWEPVDKLLKLGGITLLIKIIAFSYEWNNGGRSETVRSAMDVLSICCVTPKVLLVLCERLELPENETTSGIFSILGAAAGDIITDADIQKSALALLCHCVCSPLTRKEPNNYMKCLSSSKRTKLNNKYCEELVQKVWESVCSNNGIIVLLSLMQIKVPITDADCIRGMACRALAGLARSERVRQIIGKLPLFTSGQLQALMRDPILQEKRAEHVLFQKYALELLERISGKVKPLNNQLDPTLSNIHKANVVAQTKIQYNEQQLFQLIHEHLESKGLTQTAQTLQKEANLQLPPTTKNFHQSPFDYKVLPVSSIVRNRLRSRMQEVNTAINNLANDVPPNTSQLNSEEYNGGCNHNAPIKLVKKMEKATPTANPSTPQQQRSLQKQIRSLPDGSPDFSVPPTHTGITLSTIVTEYLTNQHALCNNPMTTCPQFDLLTPHKCPDPKPSRILDANLNLTARFFKAQAGYDTSRLDRRFVHSNFATWRTIRATEYTETVFSCCTITPKTNVLLAGTTSGEVKGYNINDGTEQFTSICHTYHIDSLKTNRSGELVLTSCSWRSPLSVLWSLQNNDMTSKLRFSEEFYCEFSNATEDKILGTQNTCAVIYDLNTGTQIKKFTPTISNQYSKNKATFNPTDELILSDGVLWDVRSGREIHKFDKLNQSHSGVFHPNGLEIISNMEVWDLRTFHLLQTVPVLDQCLVQFSPMKVLYGINMDNRYEFDDSAIHDTSFKVLDAYDYSSIATIDVKRSIYDMSINSNGSLIALVETQNAYESKAETFIKLYAVGMRKSEVQEEEEDEEGDPETDEDGSESDDSNIVALDRLIGRNGNGEAEDGNGGDDIDVEGNDEEDEDEDEDDAGGSSTSTSSFDDEDDDDNDDDDEDMINWIRARLPPANPNNGDNNRNRRNRSRNHNRNQNRGSAARPPGRNAGSSSGAGAGGTRSERVRSSSSDGEFLELRFRLA